VHRYLRQHGRVVSFLIARSGSPTHPTATNGNYPLHARTLMVDVGPVTRRALWRFLMFWRSSRVQEGVPHAFPGVVWSRTLSCTFEVQQNKQD